MMFRVQKAENCFLDEEFVRASMHWTLARLLHVLVFSGWNVGLYIAISA
jgi:hypothetical protein